MKLSAHILVFTFTTLSYALTACAEPIIDQIFGVPVVGIDSTEQAVPDTPDTEGNASYNPSDGEINYYIPITADASGIYGVTNTDLGIAGTKQSIGKGMGINNKIEALSMFLRFDAISADATDAELRLDFVDLDLDGAADNSWFSEAIRLMDANGNLITPQITAIGQTASVDDPFTFSVTGNTNTQQVVIHDILPLVDDESLVLELQFFSISTKRASNILHQLNATLITTQNGPTVPAPASLGIVVIGLVLMSYPRRSTVGTGHDGHRVM